MHNKYMYNNQFQEILEIFANIHEIRGAENDHFRTRAYRQAALTIQNLSKDIGDIYDPETGKLTEDIPGFGPAITAKAVELITTGQILELEKIKKTIPKGLLEMLEIKNLGPKRVRKFWVELGVDDLDKLKAAIESGAIAELDGMGEKSAQKILDSMNKFHEYSERRALGLIYADLRSIEQEMKECKQVTQVSIAGSARRMKETVGDLDILATGKEKDHPAIMEYFKALPYIDRLEVEGPTKITAFLTSGIQIDLRVVNDDEFGAALQYFSGSKAHNIKLRALAKKMGYKISEYGIFSTKTGEKVGGENEKDIYDKLKLQFIPVEIPQGHDEIEKAKTNDLPKLIEMKDIKGELHCHSTYSDGKHTIEQMAEEAMLLGYEYIAITDHSPSLKIANGLDKKALAKKKKEIDKLNEKLPIRILFGTEVDILSDGTLDYDDETLAEFDIVIASVHSGLEKDITERLIKAINNKHVHIIGHPTTRLIGKREPSPVDMPEVLYQATQTGTILEINSQPLRLDLRDAHIREGLNAGVKFAISTDAHNTAGLHLAELGIGQARRGWLTKKDVINTYPLDKLLKLLK